MIHALHWFVVVALLALWSLTVWALHAAAAWAVSSAGTLSAAGAGAGAVTLPGWMAPWVPPEIVASLTQLLAGLGWVVDGLLQAAPVLSDGVTAASWVIWGIGSVLLVMLGAGLSMLIALWRRPAGSGPGPGSGPAPAAG